MNTSDWTQNRPLGKNKNEHVFNWWTFHFANDEGFLRCFSLINQLCLLWISKQFGCLMVHRTSHCKLSAPMDVWAAHSGICTTELKPSTCHWQQRTPAQKDLTNVQVLRRNVASRPCGCHAWQDIDFAAMSHVPTAAGATACVDRKQTPHSMLQFDCGKIILCV